MLDENDKFINIIDMTSFKSGARLDTNVSRQLQQQQLFKEDLENNIFLVIFQFLLRCIW